MKNTLSFVTLLSFNALSLGADLYPNSKGQCPTQTHPVTVTKSTTFTGGAGGVIVGQVARTLTTTETKCAPNNTQKPASSKK